MLLGVIPIFCFGILRIFGGNRKKEEKLENLGKIGLLRHSVGNPRRGKAEVPKWHPSSKPRRSKGTPQRRPMPQSSSATPQSRYYSQ